MPAAAVSWTTIASILAATALCTVTLDQLSKYLALKHLTDGAFRPIIGRTGLKLVANRRGTIAGISTRTAGIVWLIAAAVVCYVAARGVMLPRAGVAGLGLAFGGATSNLVERVVRGAVTDFIAVGWWPVFNVADAAMVVGAGLAIIASV